MLSSLPDRLASWARWCEARAGALLVCIVLAALAGGAIASLWARIDSDLSRLIRPSDALAWYQHDQAYKAAFPQLQQTAVVVVSGDDIVAVRDAARDLRNRFVAGGEFEHVLAPGVHPFIEDHIVWLLDEEQRGDWLFALSFQHDVLAELARDASLSNAVRLWVEHAETCAECRLPWQLKSIAEAFGEDGTRLRFEGYPRLVPRDEAHWYEIIVLQGRQQLDASLPNAVQVALIEQRIDEATLPPGVRVRLTGEVKLAHEEIGAALDGIELAGSISIVFLALILGIGVRSARVIGGIFALLGTGILMTLGFATLAVGSFNTLALVFVVMFFGLGVDFAVHFALRVREAAPSPDAVAIAARDVGPALLLCMLTSSIAFLSFVPTAYRGLGELGIISAGGMAIAAGLALTLLPAFHGRFGLPSAAAPQAAGKFRQFSPLWLIPLAAVLLVCVWGARELRFDYSVLAMRDTSTEGVSTLLELQREGVFTDYSIFVLADDEDEAAALASRLEALDAVAEVATPQQLLPVDVWDPGELAPARRRHAGIIAGGTATDSPALENEADALAALQLSVAVEERELHRRVVDALRRLSPAERAAFDADLRAQVDRDVADLARLLDSAPWTLDAMPQDLRLMMLGADGRHLIRVQPASELNSRDAVEEFVAVVSAAAPNYAGRTVVEWGIGDVVVESFLQAVSLAVAAIFVLLLIYFRSLLLSVLVLIPIGFAVVVTAAIMQWTGLSLNMANILVVPLIFGLGVDTGIHVVHRYRSAGSISALQASSTPRAVLISGLTTIGTFLSLSFSPHKGAASVGLLLFIAISVMLVVTFVVLPMLLQLRDRVLARMAA